MQSTKKTLLNAFAVFSLAILNFNIAFSQTNTPCVTGSPVAPVLTVNSSCSNTSGTTVGLAYNSNNANGNIPSCGFPGAPDGWYQFVAPANGTVTITTTAGTMTDGVMSLYSGTCGGFTELACNDNGAGMPIITSSTLTPGATYFIRIWSYFSGTGTFSICITTPSASSNPCSSITAIAACGTSVSTNLTGAGGGWSTSACGFTMSGDEQIFSFTPTTTGTYSLNITTNSGGFIDYFWVNSTAGCSSSAGWNCIADVLTAGTYGNMSWTSGQTYYILLDAETTSAHSSTFSINCPVGGGGPCGTVTNIVGCGASYSTTTTGNGAWSADPCFWSTPGIETLYTYTATGTGNHAINVTSLTGGFIDFAFKPVSSGCSSTGWTCIDDMLFTGTTSTFSLTSGVQYYILVEPESTTTSSVTFNLDCPGSSVTASDCGSAVNICSNATFAIDPNGYGSIAEIPALGTVGNPSNANPGGSGNMGCMQSFIPENNSTWMVVNIATGGNLEFSFGAGGAQAGYYDWIMYPYNPATTCAAIPTGTYAPVRCNWNLTSSGGTGLASTLPGGGNAGNYEPPLAVLTGQQYIICFSNYSSAVTTVPLNFFGSATVSCTPLPSELMNFDGVVHNKMARLDWKTFTETNTSHFIIEHSLDGIEFNAIGNVNAQGNSNIETPYFFIHSEMNTGINYYRLSTVDLNEDRQVSRIIQLESKPIGFDVTDIYPNPSNDLFSVLIQTDSEIELEIEIIDIIGKQVYFSRENLNSGENIIDVSANSFAKGMYHLKITNPKNNVSVVKQIFKQD